MSNIQSQSKKLLYLVFSSFFAILYVYIYLRVPNEILRDRPNYILYASNYEFLLDERLSGSFLFNEPLFLLINQFLASFSLPETVPLIFVFINTTILMFLLIRNSSNFLLFILGLLLIIFIPYVFQSQLTALRQSLATSFFLLAFFCLKDCRKILFISFLCSFIHSVFFLISFFYFVNFFILKNRSFEIKILINFFIMLAISLSFILVTNILGMRQADVYEDIDYQKGGGSFLLFLLIFFAFYMYKKILNTDTYLFAMVGLTIFLTGYFLTPISGRLFNSFFPFVVLLLVCRGYKVNYFILLALVFVYGFLYFNGAYNNVLLVNQNSFFSFLSEIKWIIK